MKKQEWVYCLLSFTFCVLYGCGLHIVSPKPLDPTDNTSGPQVNINDQLVITMQFSESVDPSTVIPGKTFFLDFRKQPGATASLSWSADFKTLTITTQNTRTQLLDLSPDGGFTMRVIGTDSGNGIVTSSRGVALDGDYDNRPGGDYIKVYHIVG